VLLLYSSGTFSDCQILAMNATHTVMQASKDILIIFADILSLAGALPFFMLRAA